MHRGVIRTLVAGVALLFSSLVLVPAAEAAHAPPWRWQTVSTTRTVEPGTEEDVVLYCPTGYQPVSMSWSPSPFYVRRLFETYNYSSHYGYLRLANFTSSYNVTVTVMETCAHGDDLGGISTTTATIAHPTNEVSVGGYVDCPAGQTALTGSVTWDGFAAGRTIDFSTPTEGGWYASGVYPYGQSTNFRLSVHCVASGVMSGAHLAQGSGIITNAPGSIPVTATCAVGERAVGTGAFQYPSAGSVNPYAELGTTLRASQTLPLNGAGTFTAYVSAPNSSDHTVVARAWCVPYPKPVITFSTKPPTLQTSHTVTIAFTATDTAGDTVSYQCYLNGNPLACTSGQPLVLTLGDGQHNFGIRATNSVPAEKLELFSTTIDSTPPVVTFSQKPTNPSPLTSASFTMNVSDLTTVTRYCHLDSAAEAPCPNPATFSALPDGQHTFHWRVVDAAGNQSTGDYAWRVDTAAPVVTVTGKPADPTTSSAAAFTVTAEDAGSVTLLCHLDDAVEQPCPSPASYTDLADGQHTFHWRATDDAAHETAGSHTWRVDTTAPVVSVTGKPADPTSSSAAAFTVTAEDAGSVTLLCHLDDAAEQSCPTPASFTDLAEGQHTFQWRATDAVGLETIGSHTWRVDTVDPAVTVTGKPAAVTKLRTASFTVAATDQTTTQAFCHLDAAAAQPCPTPASFAALTDGLHTFGWRVVDEAGNETAGSHTWRVDTGAPTASLTRPTAPFQLGAVQVWWAGSDSGSGIAGWQLRRRSSPYNGAFGAWSSPSPFGPGTTSTTSSALTRGSNYCWQVQAVDKAGNVSPWSAQRCSAIPLDDRSLAASSGWSRVTGSGYYAGTATQTTRLGAVLTRTGAQLTRLAVVATKCPTCGIVGVYVNGGRVGTLDLYRSATANRQVITLAPFSYRTGTVTLKVLSSGELVRIDGLGISRS